MPFTSITNVTAMMAQHQLALHQSLLQRSLKRLSTGYRINSGVDDPAGLIKSELLRSEEASTKAAIANAQREDNVLATADGALSEVSNLLVQLQGLVVANANQAALSPVEVDAQQLQVDSIISSINRITGTTSFDGIHPFSGGELGFRTSAGTNFSAIENLQIHSAAVNGNPQTLSVQVIASAQHASLVYHGGTNGVNGPVVLSISGNTGQTILSFASSTGANTIAAAVNELMNSTGVTASASGNDVTFLSSGFGSSQFVSVGSNSGAFQTQNPGGSPTGRASGHDATVAINGAIAATQGLSVTSNTSGAELTFQLATTANTNGATAQFAITGGGARFSLSPQVSTAGSRTLGLSLDNVGDVGFYSEGGQAYSLSDLGSWGKLSLKTGKNDLAQKVVSGAINDISLRRAAIGAELQYAIGSTINALNVTLENLASSESAIRDTDFAAETAELTRQQILVQSATNVLVTATQSQNLILKLLGAQ